MNAPLPTITDPRKTSLGGVLTAFDLPKAGERKRWTRAYKAIVAEAIRRRLMTPAEACERYSMTSSELNRWIELLEAQGMRGLAANNFSMHTPEAIDHIPTFTDGPLTIDFAAAVAKLGDRYLHFTKSQLRLLAILISRAPTTVSKEEVYKLLYGEKGPHIKILDVMVCKIRRQLGGAVETVWGRGWRWISPSDETHSGEKRMTDLEALISVSQTLLRVRGEWVDGICSSDDIRNVVADVWTMMRIGDDTIISDAIAELERKVVG